MPSTSTCLRLTAQLQTLALVSFATLACLGRNYPGADKSKAFTEQDPANHSVQMIGVDKDVKLEVLDWGGAGRPVVLLTGLGNADHVFDDFAGVPSARVVRVPHANRYVYLSNEADVLREMKLFIGSLP
jgi:hypothetical protein